MSNGTIIQFFEWYCRTDGRHWRRFGGQVQHLLNLGITAAWLPPAYKGTRGEYSEGYDVYDIYDLGEFDQKGSVRTKYGTKEEYILAVNKARAKGLRVYVDVVLNHMGGADETERIRVRKVDPDNRLVFTSEPMEIEAYTKFTFPGRADKYSNFKWDHNCFTGIDHAADTKENAIFTIINDYGEDWEPLAHDERGNFDFLIHNDIETRNPAVRQELKNWIRWYYQTVRFDGMRLDAVKHINPTFFNEWLDFVRLEIDPDMFALGEYWLSDDLPVLLKYLDITENRMHLFDAPLHHNLSQASIKRQEYDLRNIFNDTLVASRPQQAVTFVDNHDTQPLQSLEEYTEQWFKPHAYALILLRAQGYPCVFYADLYGTKYRANNRAGEECRIRIPKLECLPQLLMARKTYAYGKQLDYFNEHSCIGWARQGLDKYPNSGCAVLLNTSPVQQKEIRMELGQRFIGKNFYNFLQPNAETIPIDENGFGDFFVDPLSVAVWVQTSDRNP